MPRAQIKRIKVTNWHEDKDTGESIARLKITFEGEDEAKVSGRLMAYLPRWQLDEWAAPIAEQEQREITMEDLHDHLYEWLFGE